MSAQPKPMPSPFAEPFARLRDVLPGSAAVRSQRLEAFERFAAIGLPTRKTERWRYTDLSKLDPSAFDIARGTDAASHADGPALAALGELVVPNAGHRLVFVDGLFVAALSDEPREFGLPVHVLADGWNVVADGFPGQSRLSQHPLALLNTVFTEDGLLVRVPPHQRSERPLVIALIGSGNPSIASQPRVVIEVGEHAEIDVILQLADAPGTAAWTNLVAEIRQDAGSKLSMLRIQDHGTEHLHTSLTTAALARDATLRYGAFELGGATVHNDIDVRLDGPGAGVDLYGAFVALGSQRVDNQVLIEHMAVETRSEQAFRGIAGDRARGAFGGKVVVTAGAQRIDARQRSDNLLLAKTAEIDTMPALEIYADDVKCSHGATVGELDEQHLFYLQSRGIGAEAARALLTFAFANAAVDRVEDGGLRRLLIDRIASRLPAHERWEHLVS